LKLYLEIEIAIKNKISPSIISLKEESIKE